MRRIRAVAHVHSEWSYDGSWSLRDIVEAFRARGHQAILTAEHDRGFDEDRWRAYREECERLSRVDCIVVPGVEYSDSENAIHVPVWEIFRFSEPASIPRSSFARSHAKRTAVLTHPQRRNAHLHIDHDCLVPRRHRDLESQV